MNKDLRTWCKYGDCSLEKLEIELEKLDKLWMELENNWHKPQDVEDLYRIYPLLDTVSAIARKKLVINGEKIKKYKVNVVMPASRKDVDTKEYLYQDENSFFNGEYKEELLATIVSTFLHASEYKYMDTRKKGTSDFIVYVFVRTDVLCDSCAGANLKKPQIDRKNYRKTVQFIQYSDCTCGTYVEVRSFINSMKCLVGDKIKDYGDRIRQKT